MHETHNGISTVDNGEKSVWVSSWLEPEFTVTTIKPVTVRSNLSYYDS